MFIHCFEICRASSGATSLWPPAPGSKSSIIMKTGRVLRLQSNRRLMFQRGMRAGIGGVQFFNPTSYLSDQAGRLISCRQKGNRCSTWQLQDESAGLFLWNGNNGAQPPLSPPSAGKLCQMWCGCQRKSEKMAAGSCLTWTCIRRDAFITVPVYSSAVTLSTEKSSFISPLSCAAQFNRTSVYSRRLH